MQAAVLWYIAYCRRVYGNKDKDGHPKVIHPETIKRHIVAMELDLSAEQAEAILQRMRRSYLITWHQFAGIDINPGRKPYKSKKLIETGDLHSSLHPFILTSSLPLSPGWEPAQPLAVTGAAGDQEVGKK
jgi:hypothetical protein